MKQCLPNDAYGRLVSELYEDGETVTYRFDNSGDLAAVIDSATGTTTKYYYDMAGRLMKYWDKSTDNSHRMTYAYDAMDNLTRRRQVTNGDVFTTSYSYDDDDRLLKVTNGDTEKIYSYDSSGWLYRQLTKADGTTVLTETVTFHGGSDHPSENVTAFTSGQIKKYTSTYANGALAYLIPTTHGATSSPPLPPTIPCTTRWRSTTLCATAATSTTGRRGCIICRAGITTRRSGGLLVRMVGFLVLAAMFWVIICLRTA